MNDASAAQHRPAYPGSKSVLDYVDETPAWADGTPVASAPMTSMQWRIWWLAAAGKFFEGLIVFMTGVAMPLIASEFGLTATQHGVIGAASLFGILIGAGFLGHLSDRRGRKVMFIAEMFFFVLFLLLLVGSPNFPLLALALFGVGLALGCDYPTAHLIISESIPSNRRGGLVLSAFGFQALGALAGAVIGFIVLSNLREVGAWRWMYASAIIPALAVAAGRFFITESGPWLVGRGRISEAERETARLLARTPPYPRTVKLDTPSAKSETADEPWRSYAELFSRAKLRALVLAAVPWFLQDLGTYGIGIFTPTILAAALGHGAAHSRNVADLISNDVMAAKGAAVVDLLLIAGIVCAALLVDRVGRIRLQVIGFIGCAAGLLLASMSADQSETVSIILICAGFMVFNFMTNLGPNAQTYLLAGEVFPTRIRGAGAGFAAAFAKMGAVMTAFLFPILLADIGEQHLLYILAVTSLLGAVITWVFRIETTGVNLDRI